MDGNIKEYIPLVKNVLIIIVLIIILMMFVFGTFKVNIKVDKSDEKENFNPLE